MRLTILALGTRGDIEPYLALGLGLQASGYQVSMAAPTNFESVIRQHGLDYKPLGIDMPHLIRSEIGQLALGTDRRYLRFIGCIREMAAPLAHRLLHDMWTACQGADAVIYSLLAFPSHFMAQDLGIPAFASCLQPLIRTKSVPAPLFPHWFNVSGGVNRFTFLLVEQVFWQCMRPFIKQWRKQQDFSPLPFWGHFNQVYRQPGPILCGYSPLIVPRSRDYPDQAKVTGFWSLDASYDWRPSDRLIDFLDAGPPPICVGFGSMNNDRAHKRITQCVRALLQERKRVVLLGGWNDLETLDVQQSDELLLLQQAPHAWLFPRVSAVIHHGGAGTTAAVLRAGIPSLILPFFFDQAFWAHRLYELGVGLKPLSSRQISVETIASEIRNLSTNREIQKNVQRLAKDLQQEDGVSQGVTVIQNAMGDKAPSRLIPTAAAIRQ